jgi:hypothetical protein
MKKIAWIFSVVLDGLFSISKLFRQNHRSPGEILGLFFFRQNPSPDIATKLLEQTTNPTTLNQPHLAKSDAPVAS